MPLPKSQPLNSGFAVTNPDGTPTDYFIRLLQQRGISSGDAIALLEQRIEDLRIDDLANVDLTTVLPVDSDLLGYDATAGKWKAAIVATVAEILAGTDAKKTVTANRMYGAVAEVAVADGATITLDGNAGTSFSFTLGGNRTLANPINMKSGQTGLIIVTQDATGSRTLTYGTNWKFPGGAAGNILSTAANTVDVISYFVRGDGTILVALSKAFAS